MDEKELPPPPEKLPEHDPRCTKHDGTWYCVIGCRVDAMKHLFGLELLPPK